MATGDVVDVAPPCPKAVTYVPEPGRSPVRVTQVGPIVELHLDGGTSFDLPVLWMWQAVEIGVLKIEHAPALERRVAHLYDKVEVVTKGMPTLRRVR
jgi:hypothetical protein